MDLNKERAEFTRLNEIEVYFSLQKTPDITIIALAFFVVLSIEHVASCFIIGLSLAKLFILVIFSVIERKFYDNTCALIGTRAIQFWIYRFILLLQLIFLIWILTQISSSSSDGANE